MSGTTTVTVHGHTAFKTYKPRCKLLVNGTERPETPLYSFQLHRTRFSRTDTASITVIADMAALVAAGGSPWFLPDTTGQGIPDPIEIELQIRDELAADSTWRSVFIGVLDESAISFGSSTVELECRDYMSRLMDMRIAKAWLNMSAHDLLVTLITAAGLTPDVAPLSDLAGKFWQIEHKRTGQVANTRFQTAYELARYVANTEQCDLYADGKTIRVKPFPKVGDGTRTHHRTISITKDNKVVGAFTRLSFKRNFMLATGLIVHVLTWDSRQRDRHEIYWSATGASKSSANTSGMLYSYMLPGLTLAQLGQQAKMLYDMLVRHLVVAELELKPDGVLAAPREFFTLSGTGWSIDNTYTIDSAQTVYDPGSGLLQSLQIRIPEISSSEVTE